MTYFDDKLDVIADIFGARDVRTEVGGLRVDGRFLPTVDDVIVALGPERWPPALRPRVGEGSTSGATGIPFAPEIQRTFGQEWTAHPRIFPSTGPSSRGTSTSSRSRNKGQRVADLGCGIGRWRLFVAEHCRDIVLVDLLGRHLRGSSQPRACRQRSLRHGRRARVALRDDAFDFSFCLGVLHHLPVDALEALRGLRHIAPRHLVYLYYALDNRPATATKSQRLH